VPRARDGAQEDQMPKFNYVAMDTKGKEITGVLESDTTTAAIGRIREMGYFPTNVTEVGKEKKVARGGPAAAPGGAGKPRQERRRGEEVDQSSSGWR